MVDLPGRRLESSFAETSKKCILTSSLPLKPPSCPSLRIALSVASHLGWPIECWDVATAFLYARLFGDRDTDLGGNEIVMRPPKILVETKVVAEGVVWKIKKGTIWLAHLSNCLGDRA